MSLNLRNSSGNSVGCKLQAASCRLWLVACSLWLVAGLTGCESLQRKFTRKPKHPVAAPTPIISFQDYTRAMTPVDRYRKHYMMFDYWNSELVESLQDSSPNPKRFKRASGEALDELKTLRSLVTDDVAPQFDPLIEQRTNANDQLQSANFNAFQGNAIARTMEAQGRQVHRELFWRNVEDHLNPQEHPTSPGTTSDTP